MGGSARARGEGARAAGRSRASLPSARSARYAISLTGHVCVTLTFTLVPFGVLGYRAGDVATAAVPVRYRVVRGKCRKVLIHSRCAGPGSRECAPVDLGLARADVKTVLAEKTRGAISVLSFASRRSARDTSRRRARKQERAGGNARIPIAAGTRARRESGRKTP